MSIDVVKGDVIAAFKSGHGHLAHGCNCFHVMGSGIAAVIAKEFQYASRADRETIKGSRSKLGTFSLWGHKTPVGIRIGINLYTQYHPGADASYEYIAWGFANINDRFGGDGNLPILIPKIGCGIGGLRWERVYDTIAKVTPDVRVIAFTLE